MYLDKYLDISYCFAYRQISPNFAYMFYEILY